MNVKVITAPFDAATRNFDTRELRVFMQNKRAVGLSDHLLETPTGAFLCLVISYEELGVRAPNAAPAPNRQPGPPGGAPVAASPAADWQTAASPEGHDRRAAAPPRPTPALAGGQAGEGARQSKASAPPPLHLGPGRQALYSRIRQWRYNRAAQLGVPPYMIMTNKELEQLVMRLPRSISELSASECVSAARVKQYGVEIVAELGRALADAAAPPVRASC